MMKPLTEIEDQIWVGSSGESMEFSLGHTRCEVLGDLLVQMSKKQPGDRNGRSG